MTTPEPTTKSESKAANLLTFQLMFLALFIIAFLLAASIVFVWWQFDQRQQQIHQEILQHQQQLASQQEKALDQVKQIKNDFTQNENQIKNLETKIDLLSQPFSNQQIWLLLSQIKLQINLANQYLNVGIINLPTAIRLFESAKASLLTLNIPEIEVIEPLLDNLDQQFSKLDANKLTDINQSLHNLSLTTDQLGASLIAAPKASSQNNQKQPISTHQVWYRSIWSTFKRYLNQIVTIRHDDEPVIPKLNLQTTKLLMSEMKLDLLQAQWSLLQQDDKLYQQSLNHYQLLLKHFPSQPLTLRLSEQVKQLAAKNLNPPLPSFTPLLIALQQIIGSLEQKPPISPENSNQKKINSKSSDEIIKKTFPATSPSKSLPNLQNEKRDKPINPAVEI